MLFTIGRQRRGQPSEVLASGSDDLSAYLGAEHELCDLHRALDAGEVNRRGEVALGAGDIRATLQAQLHHLGETRG